MTHDDEGAAVVEFVLVSVLVLSLFLLVFQVGLLLFVRNVAAAAAAEGARYAAAADRSPDDGADRAQQALREGLGNGTSLRCTAGTSDVQGAAAVEVVCRGPVPVVFLPAPHITVEVRGHALEEAR